MGRNKAIVTLLIVAPMLTLAFPVTARCTGRCSTPRMVVAEPIKAGDKLPNANVEVSASSLLLLHVASE